ncbi:E1-E2 ATPase-domain-containing protein [Achaetomium macrosporum]|uniref:E1-E2 ATPase-domain-containing protein n=1 Tax=Achaetomium macrosporum TaxID=79813 RepID=A0AAN7HAH6_9PEZI|nr:E1-E2 ATPase-domain-containing protein [Achaetomium macrosporum]
MPATGCADECCAVKTQDGCDGGNGLGNPSMETEKPEAPPCCEDKASPCCDATCLDRLALRACEDDKWHPATTETTINVVPESSCHGSEGGKPCGYHTRKTRDAYAATLEALGCICRALLALGEESCCSPAERSSIDRKRSSKRLSRVRQASPTPVSDACCATTGRTYISAPPGSEYSSGSSGAGRTGAGCCSDDSRSDRGPVARSGVCTKGCCGDKQSFPRNDHPVTTHVTPGCLDGAHLSSGGELQVPVAPRDVEKGLTGREHIVLSITGMTCTGCETKLQRALSPLAAVKNLKTSLVLARAEFDLDLGRGSLAEVLKHLERTTEFKCERVGQHGSTLDLIVPYGETADFTKRQWPKGVTDVTAIDKTTVRVAFNPGVVGARDLVERGWGAPLELAPLRPDPTLAAGSKHVRHMGYMTVLSAFLTIPVLVLAWAPLPEKEIEYNFASLALATVVQLVIAGPFYPKAIKALVFSRVIEMDLLIVLSTSTAFVFSVVSFGYLVARRPLSTESFFETSTLLVTLIMVGRFVAALARQKAVESISIHSLQPSTAILVDEVGGRDREIDTRLLQYGDKFRVAPESRIPTDGTVVSGSSEADESMVTGESKPVEKHTGSAVIAGTVNGSGTLVVRLTSLPGSNTIDMIAGMVDKAKLSKPKLQNIADRVASYFVPVVVVLTVITFVVWVVVGVTVRHQSGAEATIQAVTYAMTVLIVSCPCAIGLAVPMVIVIATGVGAEHGIIFKSAESIELAYKTSHVVLDKTGTLTEGKLSVVSEEYVDANSTTDTIASLFLGLVENIKHPVSIAVAAHLKSKGISASVVSGVKTLPGKGVEGTSPTSNLVLRAGNSRWLNLSRDPRVQPYLSHGYTVFCFTINGSLAAVFGLQDTLRADALTTITALHDRGVAVHLLSGDDDGAVHSVASQLRISPTNVRARCTPADKQSYIQDLLTTHLSSTSTTKKRPPVILFVGDGTNDAPALAQATIGIAMTTTAAATSKHQNPESESSVVAAIAKSAADIVLLRPQLRNILAVIDLSRKAVRRIAFNFAWSFVYNLLAILLAAGVLVHVGDGGVRIPPQFAGLGELVSVLPVVAGAVLLRWERV